MDEFYIGYLPVAPPGIRRRVKLLVVFLVLVAVAGAALFAISQNGFAEASFAYGKPAEFSGTIALRPFPVLIPDRAGAAPGEGDSAYLLVAPGKFGAEALLAGEDSQHVNLRGTLIRRAEGHMIEVQPGTVSHQHGAVPGEPSKFLGPATLSGEIVDTKCFLGVMNPGEGKVHRDCAARCLSGGIPPALISGSLDGVRRLYLLLDSSEEPLRKEDFLQKVGRPVSISGQVVESQGIYYLHTSAANIELTP